MLCLCGAKALDEDDQATLARILKEPLEVEESSGKFSHRPLVVRRELFYPDAFLGYADQPMSYMDELWKDTPHLKAFFANAEDYQLALAKFFVVIALVSPFEGGRPLYPGYRLLSQANKGMSYLTSKLFSSPAFQKDIAGLMGISVADLPTKWTEIAKSINSISSGSRHVFWHETKFPEEFGKVID